MAILFRNRIYVILFVLALACIVFNMFSFGRRKKHASDDMMCTEKQACAFAAELAAMARAEAAHVWMNELESDESRHAAWLASKARYALYINGFDFDGHKKQDGNLDEKCRKSLAEWHNLLVLACHQRLCGVKDIAEEQGARLRGYVSDIDQSIQTYSVTVPSAYDSSLKWPLIVSLHGHGWFRPFQGHPAKQYAGAFCVAPFGRGATDYKEIGEDDVLHVIDEVCRDYNIDLNRIYLTGSSMGGTGAFHIATRYADRFAAINPIAGNADNEAWTEAWGWNKSFPGRYDSLRKWIQDGHTARAFAENLLNVPAFVIAGTGDTVVPVEHSRSMVRILRQYKSNVEYREFPGCGHGGFPEAALDDALAWTCSWERNASPKSIFWKADKLKYGKAYWLRMEQFEKPLKTGFISGSFTADGRLAIRTSNLLAFSFQRPEKLFSMSRQLVINVNGRDIKLENLPDSREAWITIRKDPNHGWTDERLAERPQLYKHAGLEGPVSEVLNAPFMLVVGTTSPNSNMNRAWMEEARRFSAEWERRNGAPCIMVTDDKCRIEDMQSRNLILFGNGVDNSISDMVSKNIPLADVMSNLPLRNKEQELGENDLDAPDLGSIIMYPNVEYAPNRMIVMLSANSPDSAYQMWGRFGNWFNWGVYDSSKYFDYAVFDSRSASPETMLMVGWFGTDWNVDSGVYFIGNEELRAGMAPQGYPPFDEVPANAERVLLAELKPVALEQMRGALGIGRSFFGEPLSAPGSLGMRAPCVIEYDINGAFSSFSSGIALIPSREASLSHAREKGESVKFTIYGDGRKIAEKSVSWSMPEDRFDVNIMGIRKLKLEAVSDKGPAWLHMSSAWLEPTLGR